MDKLVLVNIILQVFYFTDVNTIAKPQSKITENPFVIMKKTTGTGQTLDIREEIKKIVGNFCPLVDICATNASNADLEHNGDVGTGRVSCCRVTFSRYGNYRDRANGSASKILWGASGHVWLCLWEHDFWTKTGCSCHPDCEQRNNCCFPDDFESDGDGTSGYECLYTRIGPEETIDALVPAFKTIVATPKGGCVNSKPFNIAPSIALTPTCEDTDVTPLGSYFPVYSGETGEIYKNIMCARCHGVKSTVSFQPILGCESTLMLTKANVLPLSDILSFLESKILSTSCRVDFQYAEMSILESKRCYKNVISSCKAENITVRIEWKPTKLDVDTIKELCESGFNSPTVLAETGLVYRNVFCSLCGHDRYNLSIPSLCKSNDNGKTNVASFAFLLNPKIMHTLGQVPAQIRQPEVCLTKPKIESQNECKKIYCPTGQIRNEDGDCVFVGNFLNNKRFMVQLSLTPKLQNNFDNFDEKIDKDILVHGIMKGNPWPKDWSIKAIEGRNDDTICDERAIVIVSLLSREKRTKAIVDDVKKSLKSPWILHGKNTTATLYQSFLQYYRIRVFNISTTKLVPSWQAVLTDPDFTENFFGCGPIEWNHLYVFLNEPLISGQPSLTKLYVCDQIQLLPDEFILGPGQVYLTSNLTNRALHDHEFDLMENTQGRIQARVCLQDTIFTTKKSNGGNMLCCLGVTFLAALCICQIIPYC